MYGSYSYNLPAPRREMPKYSVPWLDDADFRPCGDLDVILENTEEIACGITIRCPFGPDTDTMLTVHLQADGEIAASEGQPKDVMPPNIDTNLQRGPLRADEDDGA